MREFKEGDVVQLRSGGPEMTIVAFVGDLIRCKWYRQKEDNFGMDEFDACALEAVKK